MHTYRGKCGKCPAKVLLILQRALAVLSIKRAGPLFGNSIKCRLMSQVTLYIGLSLVIMEHTDRLTKIPRLSSAVCAFMLSTNYPPTPPPPPLVPDLRDWQCVSVKQYHSNGHSSLNEDQYASDSDAIMMQSLYSKTLRMELELTACDLEGRSLPYLISFQS